MTSFGPYRSQLILPAPRGREQSALRSARGLFVQWFRSPDQFDRFNRYIKFKGLELAIRLVLLVSLSFLICVLVLLRFSEAGVHNQFTSVMNAVGIANVFTMAVLFAVLPVLTRRWSYLFVTCADLGVMIGVFLNRDPLVGLIQCCAFALVGGYVAYFHNARLQTAHIVWATVVVATIGRQVAESTDRALASGLSLIIGSSIVVIPFACQFILSLLGSDAENSDIDPLTGLLNRRGLQRAVGELGVVGHDSVEASYVVVIIDVDDFKRVNDSGGHEVGDQVLRDVAERLGRCGSEQALFSRFGGDEFVLVDIVETGSERRLEENLHRHLQLDEYDPTITTSIGIAIATATRSRVITSEELADLFSLADTSMYQAKDAGGNRVILGRNDS